MVERLVIHGVDENLVVDSAEEGFVRQIARLQVGRKHHHQLERDLEFHAISQHQVVHAPVQWNDPAVQEVSRRHQLAAEVVDDENAIVGLHLQRRGINTGGLVQAQLQHAGDQFAAYYNARSTAQHPAGIDVVVFRIQFLVHHRVVQTNDLVVHYHY